MFSDREKIFRKINSKNRPLKRFKVFRVLKFNIKILQASFYQNVENLKQLKLFLSIKKLKIFFYKIV